MRLKWLILLLIPSSLFGADVKKIIVGPEGRLQYYPANISAGGLPLPEGATNYIQVRDSLQPGSTAYITTATVMHLNVSTINAMEVRASSVAVIGNLSIFNGVSGNGGAITVSSYNVRGTSIFGTTWTTRGMDGTVIKVTTGTLAANTSITISASNLNLSAISWVMCSEIENINTAATSVRPKALTALPASFDVYNADVINAKGFSCISIGRP